MKSSKRNLALALTVACTPFFLDTVCETALAMEGHVVQAPASGYLNDADVTRAQGGVGNYLFRYIKEPENKVSVIDDDFSFSSQSSAIRSDEQIEEKMEKKLFFKPGSAKLSPGNEAKIDSIANTLKANPSKTVNIDGYSDATGNKKHNLNLSERRAQAVVEELKGKGVSTSQLRWQGKGIEDPIGNNATENGRMKNRRVEIYEE